jgi:hypothetical protein
MSGKGSSKKDSTSQEIVENLPPTEQELVPDV